MSSIAKQGINLLFNKVGNWVIVPFVANAIRDLGPKGYPLTRNGGLFVLAVAFSGGLVMWSAEYEDSLLFIGGDLELFFFFCMFRFEVLFVFPCPLLGLLMN